MQAIPGNAQTNNKISTTPKNNKMNNPKKEAYMLALKMRQFQAKCEVSILSENANTRKHSELREVLCQVDWNKFDDVINYLEFSYKQQNKPKFFH